MGGMTNTLAAAGAAFTLATGSPAAAASPSAETTRGPAASHTYSNAQEFIRTVEEGRPTFAGVITEKFVTDPKTGEKKAVPVQAMSLSMDLRKVRGSDPTLSQFTTTYNGLLEAGMDPKEAKIAAVQLGNLPIANTANLAVLGGPVRNTMMGLVEGTYGGSETARAGVYLGNWNSPFGYNNVKVDQEKLPIPMEALTASIGICEDALKSGEGPKAGDPRLKTVEDAAFFQRDQMPQTGLTPEQGGKRIVELGKAVQQERIRRLDELLLSTSDQGFKDLGVSRELFLRGNLSEQEQARIKFFEQYGRNAYSLAEQLPPSQKDESGLSYAKRANIMSSLPESEDPQLKQIREQQLGVLGEHFQKVRRAFEGDKMASVSGIDPQENTSTAFALQEASRSYAARVAEIQVQKSLMTLDELKVARSNFTTQTQGLGEVQRLEALANQFAGLQRRADAALLQQAGFSEKEALIASQAAESGYANGGKLAAGFDTKKMIAEYDAAHPVAPAPAREVNKDSITALSATLKEKLVALAQASGKSSVSQLPKEVQLRALAEVFANSGLSPTEKQLVELAKLDNKEMRFHALTGALIGRDHPGKFDEYYSAAVKYREKLGGAGGFRSDFKESTKKEITEQGLDPEHVLTYVRGLQLGQDGIDLPHASIALQRTTQGIGVIAGSPSSSTPGQPNTGSETPTVVDKFLEKVPGGDTLNTARKWLQRKAAPKP